MEESVPSRSDLPGPIGFESGFDEISPESLVVAIEIEVIGSRLNAPEDGRLVAPHQAGDLLVRPPQAIPSDEVTGQPDPYDRGAPGAAKDLVGRDAGGFRHGFYYPLAFAP